jgi:hypothetical protein
VYNEAMKLIKNCDEHWEVRATSFEHIASPFDPASLFGEYLLTVGDKLEAAHNHDCGMQYRLIVAVPTYDPLEPEAKVMWESVVNERRSMILTFPYRDFSKYACGFADDTP